ncbi:hypothetical protein LRS56_00580 [Pseudomonas poae]|nr:hypothetical protein LRS56_00580 [Pseudomonas poae]
MIARYFPHTTIPLGKEVEAVVQGLRELASLQSTKFQTQPSTSLTKMTNPTASYP